MSKKAMFDSPTSDAKTIAAMKSLTFRTLRAGSHMMQVLLASCLMHVVKHGDVTILNNLIKDEGLPKGYRGKSLVDYCTYGFKFGDETLAFLRVEGKEFAVKKAVVARGRQLMEELGEAKFGTILMSINHADITKEDVFAGWDNGTKLVSLLKTNAAALADDKKASKIKNVALLSELFDLARKHGLDLGELTREDFVPTVTIDATANTNEPAQPEQPLVLAQIAA